MNKSCMWNPRIFPAVTVLAATCAITPLAVGELHVVEQVGLDFVPAQITAEPGDTIRWVWSSGTHTVTSGAGCAFDGLYFDEPLTAANPLVQWQVPAELEGELEYYCKPHCTLGMIASILVEPPAQCPADVTGDALVDVLDLLDVLAQWGTSGTGDITGDGIVDVLDLLDLLAAWGPCR